MSSTLKKQAIALYRSFFRALRDKDPESRLDLTELVRDGFRKNAKVPRMNIQLIEHYIRQGQRKLEMLKSKNLVAGKRV